MRGFPSRKKVTSRERGRSQRRTSQGNRNPGVSFWGELISKSHEKGGIGQSYVAYKCHEKGHQNRWFRTSGGLDGGEVAEIDMFIEKNSYVIREDRVFAA